MSTYPYLGIKFLANCTEIYETKYLFISLRLYFIKCNFKKYISWIIVVNDVLNLKICNKKSQEAMYYPLGWFRFQKFDKIITSHSLFVALKAH